jgi:hypothetical protein
MSDTSIGLGGYIPPSFLMQHVINPIARAIGRPTLIVRGRISGREISTPVAPFQFGGDTYVIAGRGETQWVRNLRVAGHQLVVASYLERLGRRAPAFLAELPNPADHPIFRLEPTGPPVRG